MGTIWNINNRYWLTETMHSRNFFLEQLFKVHSILTGLFYSCPRALLLLFICICISHSYTLLLLMLLCIYNCLKRGPFVSLRLGINLETNDRTPRENSMNSTIIINLFYLVPKPVPHAWINFIWGNLSFRRTWHKL